MRQAFGHNHFVDDDLLVSLRFVTRLIGEYLYTSCIKSDATGMKNSLHCIENVSF